MFKLYNAEKQFIRNVSDIAYTELKKESMLSNGDKQLSFQYFGKYTDILPEYYVETEDDRYVVKEVRPQLSAVEYVCKLDLEALEAFTVPQFTAKDKTIFLAANQALLSTGWTCSVDQGIASKVRSVQQFNKTPYELLLKIRDAFMCEISFDSINKVVSFAETLGSDRGVYMRPELNLKDVSLALDSYDFYTRIIPRGEGGLDIKAVNSGIEYVENYQYSTKIRTLYWEDSSYTSAQALKDDAIAKLADLSKPKKSYSADVRDLAKLSNDYSILDYSLGDTVTIVDEPLGIKDTQRIVTITEYPDDPTRNTVELSNTVLTWEEYQERLSAAADAWDDVSNADGSINGVYVHGVQSGDVVGVEVVVGESGETYTGDLQTAVNQMQSFIGGKIGTIETTYLKATMANIDTANINTAKIKDLFVQVGLIRDAVISGARITGYLDAVEVNAASITAGTLIADRIAIRGDTSSIVYALNNYGQLTSQEVNTVDGYILTDRTINADKIVAHSITANEITASNLVGANGWINLAQGTFNYGNALTWDGSALTVSGTVTADDGRLGGWNASKYALYSTIKGGNGVTTTVAMQNAVIYADLTNCEVETGDGQFTLKALENGDISMSNLRLMLITPYTEASFALWGNISRTGSGQINEFGVTTLVEFDGIETDWGTSSTNRLGNYEFYNVYGGNPDCTTGARVAFSATGCNKGDTFTITFSIGPDTSHSKAINWNTGDFLLPVGSVMGVKRGSSLLYSLGTNGSVKTSGLTVEHSSYAQVNVVNSIRSARLQVNASGYLGIYDVTNGSWMFRSDTSQNVEVPHPLLAQGWADTTTRRFVQSTTGDGGRVGYMSANSTGLSVRGQWGVSGSTYDNVVFPMPGSDIRIKSDIIKSDVDALDLIRRIAIMAFKKRGIYQPIGMIADWLEELDPRLAIGGGEDLKCVDTFYLQGYEIRALQQLADKIDDIYRRIA